MVTTVANRRIARRYLSRRVVAGKYASTFPREPPLGIFALAAPGVPSMLMGLVYLMLFAHRLLPGFKELARRAEEQGLSAASPSDSRGSFLVRCLVPEGSPAAGRTISEAGLRHLPSLFLANVERAGERIPAVGPAFQLAALDVLEFTGLIDELPRLCTEHGLLLLSAPDGAAGASSDGAGPDASGPDASEQQLAAGIAGVETRLVRALVRAGSSLAGKTAREAGFRARYDAAIVSLVRPESHAVLHSNLGRLPLAVGDELLLVVGDSFSWVSPAVSADLKPLPARGRAGSGPGSSLAPGASAPGAPPVGPPPVEAAAAAQAESGLVREFLMPMRVTSRSGLIGARSLHGLTVEQAGLRGLPGVFLVAVERETGAMDYVVGPDTTLVAGDLLWFVGERQSLPTLRRVPGLGSVDDQASKLRAAKDSRLLVECVVSLGSDLLGRTIREARFRTRFDAAVVAVHRQGRRVLDKVGDIELSAGDVLVLETGPSFVVRFANDPNFILLAEIDDSVPPRFNKFWIASAAAVIMIALPIAFEKYISLLTTAVFAAAVMVATGCLTGSKARQAVSWDVIVTVACAFGISTALEKTKMATLIGQVLVTGATSTGTGFLGILVAIYLATSLITLIVANNAAALLMFPIAVLTANDTCPADMEPKMCQTMAMYTLMFAASACFASPYGYQTNIMVMGPGQYRFMDFVKIGAPMQVWQLVFDVLWTYYMQWWYINWAASLAALVLVSVVRMRPACLFGRRCSTSTTDDDKDSRPADVPGEEQSDTKLMSPGMAQHTSIHVS
jgi:di/tricarboxylate transporter